MDPMVFFVGIAAVVLAYVGINLTIKIVPQQQVWILERLGKFHTSLQPGLNFVWPFIDVVRYKHLLKEIVLDIPAQAGITKDNVSVHVDGVIFYRLIDPVKASYGIHNYQEGIIQMAQTTLRSEIGKIDLDRTFEEREKINSAVIIALEHVTEPWGVKVLRYEIKQILPPKDVLDAMEKQMRAEREKRAKILESEADRDSKINRAEGLKQETIKSSEADKQKQINEAEGKAAAILAVANAEAQGLRQIAGALASEGGAEAARIKVAEEYIKQIGAIAMDSKSIVVPANLTDPTSVIATAMTVMETMKPVVSSSPVRRS